MKHLHIAAGMALLCAISLSSCIYHLAVPPKAETRDEGEYYYGDTLCQYDGKTVVINHGDFDHELSSLPLAQVVTYVDTTPAKRSAVVGLYDLSADSLTLKIAVGVDTARYDVRNLPKTINPLKALSPVNVAEHKYVRSFSRDDSSRVCGFKFLGYLPEQHPKWLNQFISIVMHNTLQSIYQDDSGIPQALKDYNSIKSAHRKCNGIDAWAMTPEEIAGYFALVHERTYLEEFKDERFAGYGLKYDYFMEVSPVWISQDGRLITYRFYTYGYMGGSHGLMEEFYLTFNNQNGNLLGYKDIIGQAAYPQAIAELGKQVDDYCSAKTNSAVPNTPDLNDIPMESVSSRMFKEKYNGSYYPRPAITSQGIVFSYQPYEKSAFCDGTLHFTLDPLLKRN